MTWRTRSPLLSSGAGHTVIAVVVKQRERALSEGRLHRADPVENPIRLDRMRRMVPSLRDGTIAT